jgi:hypothetical protein
MPKCKNDNERTYLGTEPSPKGFGWCAHKEKIGVKRKGKDGNMWIIKEVKNGSKRWIKFTKDIKSLNDTKSTNNNVRMIDNKNNKIDCTKFVSYRKKLSTELIWKKKKIIYDYLYGLDAGKKQIYKFISYNKFEKETTKISEGYRKFTMNKKIINQEYCGNMVYLDENNKEYLEIKKKMKGYKKYMTLRNRWVPYLCYIKKNNIYIYKKNIEQDIPYHLYYPYNTNQDWMYTKFVKHYKCIKIFIGKDTGLSNFSEGGLDGNTILLQIEKNKYVFIEGIIYEFTTTDQIINYFSLVGNNEVPYPIALGKENVYFMKDDGMYIPRKYFPEKMIESEFENAYSILYNFYNNKKISNNAEEFQLHDFKKIDSYQE